MEKITKYFSFDYDKDTTIEYVNTGLYSTLNCSYTSEDPDYGTDTLHYNAKPSVSMEQMAYEFVGELKHYLDKKDKGQYAEISIEERMKYGDYSNSTLYAIEKALKPIADEYHARAWFGRLEKSCIEIAARFITEKAKRFSFCTASVDDADDYSPEEYENIGEEWFGIKRLDPIFDNGGYEYIIAIGYYGGGSMELAYFYGDHEPVYTDVNIAELADKIMNAILRLLDFDKNTLIYVTEEKEGK